MTKHYHYLGFLFLFLTAIHAQTTAIPDANFEQALIDLNIDTDGLNGSVETANISGVISLNVSSKSISDLTGIEDFISLTSLYCFDNQLTSLDVTKNTALTFMQCFSNQITSIDVTKNTALTFLNFNGNQLTSIDLSQNTLLTSLGIFWNQLTSLDTSKNTALTYIQCQGNQLTALDVSKNTALSNLVCGPNQLTDLDLNQNIALTKLNCSGTQLSVLDISKNTLLTDLTCSDMPLLTTLDLSNNTSLEYLSCPSNLILTTLNIANNTFLKELWCYSNPLLTAIDLSNNTALEVFHGAQTPFTSLDFSNNPALTVLNCSYNPLLTSLNVKNGNNASLTSFDARNNFLLKCIQVDDETAANAAEAPYTTWIKDESCIYSEDCQAALTVDDDLLVKGLHLYPNPVNSILTIDSQVPLTKVEIYSVSGQKIKEISSNFNNISTDNLSTGIYVFKIYSENGTAIKKLIKN